MAFAQKHDNGDIIYHEGDKGYSAYVLKEGVVELFKGGSKIPYATLSSGDVFGEKGMVDGGKRSETAVAATGILLEVLTQNELVAYLKENPDLTVGLMKRMAERENSIQPKEDKAADVAFEVLHEDGHKTKHEPANALVPTSQSANAISTDVRSKPKKKKRGLGEAVRTLFVRHQIMNKLKSNIPTVIICKLTNDDGDKYRKSLQACFEEVQGMIVRFPENDDAIGAPVFDGVSENLGDKVESFQETAEKQAQKLFKDEHGDVVIWGGKRGDFLEIYITVADDNVSGLKTYLKPLSLPENLNADAFAFVKAVAISNIGNSRANSMKNNLPMYLEMAKRVVVHVPAKLDNKSEIDNLVCYADVAFELGKINASWFNVAAEFYMTALKLIKKENKVEYTYVNYQVALILSAKAGRTKQHKLLHQAIEYCGYALETADYRYYPQSFATIKVMLGKLLFKSGLMNADEKELKEAISAYQSGLKYYNRLEYPMQWAEAIELLAQALRHYGEYINSSAAIEQAISLCSSAVEIRSKKKYPLLWADSKNSLGLTQFMMGVHTGKREHYKEASNAFHEALSVYNSHDAKKRAAMAEKNLVKAETMYSSTPSENEKAFDTLGGGVSVSLSADALAAASSRNKQGTEPKTTIGVKGLRKANVASVDASVSSGFYDGEKNVYGEYIPSKHRKKHPEYLDKTDKHHEADRMGIMVGDLPWQEDQYYKKPYFESETPVPVQDTVPISPLTSTATDKYIESTISAEREKQIDRGFGKSSAYTLADSLSDRTSYATVVNESQDVEEERRTMSVEEQQNSLEKIAKQNVENIHGHAKEHSDLISKVKSLSPKQIDDILDKMGTSADTMHPTSFENEKQ